MTKYILGGIAALLVIGALAGPSDSKTDTAPADSSTTTETAAPAKVKAEAKPPKPSMTQGQRNALESAEGYLDSGAFSRKSLAEQVRFEKFAPADVQYAISHVHADYMAEAVESAEGYLDSGSFSQSGLADQLRFEGFTPAQVQHAVSKAYR